MVERKPNTQYVLSCSYGKDSLACLGAIEALGLPLDRIIHAEVWATDTIPADLPDMVEFKAKADEIILRRWGIKVEHFRAPTTYEREFYRVLTAGKRIGTIKGFPMKKGPWCNGKLKMRAVQIAQKSVPQSAVQYVGIAADEKKRLERIDGVYKISPLAAVGWSEANAYTWCERNGLLAPTYKHANRGGCWFCHNAPLPQLRFLRRNYPELWAMMLKWDSDSPVKFRTDGRTLHDVENRFKLEDVGFCGKNFHWSDLDKYSF